jgi:hypothetical protein
VRGDDRSSRYPPRGVWFGLILAVGTVRALSAQDVPAEDDPRRLADPVVLAANRVTQWQTAGASWVRLVGDASVLQAVDGVRAREAIVRITDGASGVDKIQQVEVYAEGDVRLSGAATSTLPAYRGAFRTTECQLKCYDAGRPQTVNSPPWDLSIIRRSGFLVQKRAGAGQAAASGGPLPARGLGGSPEPALVSASQSLSGATPLVATQAIAPYTGATPEDGPAGPTGAGPRSSDEMGPRRDPMVERAGLAGEPAASAAIPGRTTATADPQVQQARAPQVPGGGAQPPDIDLPPIEGKPEVQVPKLPANPEDLPPNIEPLPAPDGSITVPELPRRGPVEGENNDVKPGPPPPVVPFIGGFRTTSLFTRSGRRLQIVELPATPDGVKTYICRGGINIVTQSAKSGTLDIEADEAVIWRGPDPKALVQNNCSKTLGCPIMSLWQMRR